MKDTRIAVIGVLAALALSSVALTPTAAMAATQDKPPRLRDTTCTYDQVVKSLQHNNPRAAARLAKHKRVSDRLRSILELSPKERQAKIDSRKQKHPHRAARHQALLRHHPRVRHVVRKSLETCDQY